MDTLAIYKHTVIVEHIIYHDLAIQEGYADKIDISHKHRLTGLNNDVWLRSGLLYGLWIPCDTFQTQDNKCMKYIIQRTYDFLLWNVKNHMFWNKQIYWQDKF